MKDLVEQALEPQVLLEKHGWQFRLIGGVAVQRWSEPRLTRDMDITLLTGFAFASRPLDWNDVRGVRVRQGTKNLDWPYIGRQLQPLCDVKEAPEIMIQLENLHREVATSEATL